jgi:GT2 family glycosyltransferase
MDISCVILTWNSERYIAKCLDSLISDLEKHDLNYEIIIVDNGSCDETVSIVRTMHLRYSSRIIPFYLNHNTGTTYPRNLAFKRAQGRYFCVLDSDVEVLPGAIGQLIHTIEQNNHIGLIAPKLVYPNGILQKSTDVFPSLMTKIIRFLFLKAIEMHDHALARDVNDQHLCNYEVDYAISAMWIFKRELLEQVGLLDEKIFYAPEDVDFCLRIWIAGRTVVYDPVAVCVHHTQEISRRRINWATIQHVLGLFYYFRKHRCFFVRPKKRHL